MRFTNYLAARTLQDNCPRKCASNGRLRHVHAHRGLLEGADGVTAIAHYLTPHVHVLPPRQPHLLPRLVHNLRLLSHILFVSTLTRIFIYNNLISSSAILTQLFLFFSILLFNDFGFSLRLYLPSNICSELLTTQSFPFLKPFQPALFLYILEQA